VRSAAPGLRYGTADSWNKYADGAADPVVAVSDILLCNAFAYWQGAAIGNAVNVFNDDISQAFARVKSAAGGKQPELWVGETGWPSAGTTYQQAVPTLDNARRFYKEGVCPKVEDGTNVFVFEAFDEPWKPESIGADGNPADETHWGVMTVDRNEKYSLKC
jgi:glucan 1,3-beta-glucosidase